MDMDIWKAIRNDDLENVTQYIEKMRSDIDGENATKKRPLHEDSLLTFAFYSGSEKVAKYLFTCGDIGPDKNGIRVGNVHSRDRDGWTPIMYACVSGNESLIRLILDSDSLDAEEKQEVLDERSYRGNTALIFASWGWDISGNVPAKTIARYPEEVDVVRLLVERGSDVSVQNDNGHNAFTTSIKRGKTHIAKYLAKPSILSSKCGYGSVGLYNLIPRNENVVPVCEHFSLIEAILPLYIERARNDTSFAYAMECDIRGIGFIAGNGRRNNRFPLTKKEVSILVKLSKAIEPFVKNEKSIGQNEEPCDTANERNL